MVKLMNCPVCGTENKREYYTDCVGLVEDHYLCKKCGYFYQMAYSPALDGIVIPDGMSHEEFSSLYGNKAEELHLRIYTPEEADFL